MNMKSKKEYLNTQLNHVQTCGLSLLYYNQPINTLNDMSTELAKLQKEIDDYRSRLDKIYLDKDFISFCKDIDKKYSNAKLEHEFCLKFGLEYTGKLDLSLVLQYNTGLRSAYNNVNTIEYKNKILYINGNRQRMECEKLIFIDKEFTLNSPQDCLNIIEHFKKLKERIKIQELNNDF